MNLEQQIEHYKAVKQRIATGTPKPIQIEQTPEEQPQLEELIYRWVANKPSFRDPRLQIVAQCAKEYGCTVADIFGPRKPTNIVLARRKAAYLLVQRKRTSIADVGRYLNRDHTTILHAVKMYEKALARGEGKSVQSPTAQMDETAGERHYGH
jgi:chromosomal replication initiation ATPase DnaA